MTTPPKMGTRAPRTFKPAKSPHLHTGRRTRRVFYRRVARWAKKAGIERRVCPKLLRQTFATKRIGDGELIVAQMMGHATTRTLKRYVGFVTEQHKKSVAKQGEWVKGIITNSKQPSSGSGEGKKAESKTEPDLPPRLASS